jgi:hypothetical protein
VKTFLLIAAVALTACKKPERPPPAPYADLELPDAGTAKLSPVPDGPLLRITPTSIELDGAPTPVAGLEAAAAELGQRRPGRLLVAVEPKTPYPAFVAAITAARGAYPTWAILARSHGEVGVVLMEPPTATPSDATPFAVITLLARALILGQRPIERGELHAGLADLRAHGVAGVAIEADDALTAGEVVPVIAVARSSFTDVLLSKRSE